MHDMDIIRPDVQADPVPLLMGGCGFHLVHPAAGREGDIIDAFLDFRGIKVELDIRDLNRGVVLQVPCFSTGPGFQVRGDCHGFHDFIGGDEEVQRADTDVVAGVFHVLGMHYVYLDGDFRPLVGSECDAVDAGLVFDIVADPGQGNIPVIDIPGLGIRDGDEIYIC